MIISVLLVVEWEMVGMVAKRRREGRGVGQDQGAVSDDMVVGLSTQECVLMWCCV